MCECHRVPQGTVYRLLMEQQRPHVTHSLLAVVKPGMDVPFGLHMLNPGDLECRKESWGLVSWGQSWCSREMLVDITWLLLMRNRPGVLHHISPLEWAYWVCSLWSPPLYLSGGQQETWPLTGAGWHWVDDGNLGWQHLCKDMKWEWDQARQPWWVLDAAPIFSAWSLLAAISPLCWSQGPAASRISPSLANKLSGMYF